MEESITEPKEHKKEPRKKIEREEGGMKIGLLDLLWPVLPFLPMLPIKGTIMISKNLRKTAKEEATDKAGTQEAMLELQMRYEVGEISEEEYEQQEAQLLDKLEAIRKDEEQN